MSVMLPAGLPPSMAKRTSNQTIVASTEWADAGYDCDHCGGRVLRRTDHETGLRDRSCLQCEQCSCQWTLERQPLRVGTIAACRAAQRQRATAAEAIEAIPRWLLVALVVVGVLILARSGVGVLLRVGAPLLPVALAAAAILYRRRRGAR